MKDQKIKLSDEELLALKKYTKGGGFQYLFKKIIESVDENNILILNDTLRGEIGRNANDYKKGGFQLTLKNIFEKHLS